MSRRRNIDPKEQVNVHIPISIMIEVCERAYKEGKSISGFICELVTREIKKVGNE